ncbi:hypothetical protein K1T71_011194 [Dendrolimus kikuchii]|uniref:Uncharacterized protein n=1 Tax=Dendrolimus kikuchii TaxID=765133 RepID=A0ACC1CN57_9NEOP|nr:hypothetical protein K1T71_011194 [Dendrolimus kikuchii]
MYKTFFMIIFTINILVYGDDDETFVSIDEEYATPVNCKQFCGENVREKRVTGTTVRSKILDAMMRTSTIYMNPNEPDIFGFLRDRYDLPKNFKGPLVEYDFIVIGAGSAGSVLASRLSEGRKASVLVLEAGKAESLITDVPILAPLLQQTDYVWPYLMEYQPNVCTGMTEGRCFWPRGRAIGGTSVVNYMIYTRGMKVDWDRIAADGNYGCWKLAYEGVVPYPVKGFRDVKRDGHRLSISLDCLITDMAFLDASKVYGHRRVDYNSPDAFGFSFIQATMSGGHRASSAKAFLHNHKKRKNLHILPDSRVTKVIIDPTTKTATGVEFHRNGKIYKIRAKKEVILSAGPIESPHLLMLSGVGPKSQLQSFGIPVIQDLKVGEILYDHISFPTLTFILNDTRLTIVERKLATINTVIQFDHYGDGPMSSLAGVETIGYIKTNISKESDDVPDIELIGTCGSITSDEGKIGAKGIHIADWLYNDVYKPIENVESFAIIPMLIHPKSFGSLKLRSGNPFDYPKLYGNYLTHPDDMATLIASIRYSIKLVETPPFQKYGAKLYTKKFPNCKQHTFNSDSYWDCALRTTTATLHHQIATCKMGPSSDPNAVVDPELRVYGIKNLRVADSSIIPRTIAAHTNAPAIMIGERAADFIKNTWQLY